MYENISDYNKHGKILRTIIKEEMTDRTRQCALRKCLKLCKDGI